MFYDFIALTLVRSDRMEVSMDFREISNLIDAVSKSKLTFFEVESEGIRIKMEKKNEQIIINNSDFEKDTSTLLKKSTIEETKYDTVTDKSNDDNLASSKFIDERLSFVTAPIVGAVYFSPGPDSNNFVKVGSKVKKGDTLCIIEAMKLMNEIECEVDGEIIEILVDNEQMVEYGQPIFKVMKEKEGK